jgi:hypothetical protein
MNQKANPWVDRFTPIANVNAIIEKTRLRVSALNDLENMLPEEAADRIKDAWDGTFYPTERDCQIMLEVVQVAMSHAARHHPDYKTHLGRSYQEQMDIDPYVPMLLLGPAGTGKSELGKALLRLFPAPSSIEFDPGHGPIPLVSIQSVKAQGRNSVASVIQLLAPDSTDKVRLVALYELCARHQYVCGTCCLLVDELQFFTQSKDANTLLTRLMLGISYIKVPYLVIANYSFAHRLMRRNSEELQRLVGRPIVLLPDGPKTKDWISVLEEYQRVVPGIYDFSFAECGALLWSLCAGLKRVVLRLLVLAYRQVRYSGRFQVTLDDVETAYSSLEFSGFRSDVESLVMHGMASAALREDLRCPFPIEPTEGEKFNAALRDSRAAKVAAAAFHDSISVTERKAIDFVKKVLNRPVDLGSNAASPVVPKTKRVKRTAESIKEAGERFRNRL